VKTKDFEKLIEPLGDNVVLKIDGYDFTVKQIKDDFKRKRDARAKDKSVP